jgi:hypothetical protein
VNKNWPARTQPPTPTPTQKKNRQINNKGNLHKSVCIQVSIRVSVYVSGTERKNVLFTETRENTERQAFALAKQFSKEKPSPKSLVSVNIQPWERVEQTESQEWLLLGF